MKKLEDVGVLVARILMPILFITAGWGKITGYAGTQQYMEAMGVPGALLPLTILLEFGGGLAMVFMKRILSLFSVLFLVTLVTFIMTNLAPSDSAEMYYLSKGITPSEEVLNETRHEMGLDKNIVVRYVDWLNDFVHGDLGYSYHYGQDVNQQMLSKLPNTLKLAMFSFVVVLAFSIPLGIYSATHRHSLINSILKNISFLGLSLPNFWLALLLILLFSVKIQLFPVISGSSLKGLVLPVCCLSFPLICSYTRMIQNAILEQLNQDYIIGLKARGMKQSEILLKHVLPHVFTTLSSLLGLSIGHLLGGTAIIETIFSYQGLGNMVVEAIRYRDYPIIQAYAIYMALIYVFVNLFVDIFQQVLNPRLRRRFNEKKVKN